MKIYLQSCQAYACSSFISSSASTLWEYIWIERKVSASSTVWRTGMALLIASHGQQNYQGMQLIRIYVSPDPKGFVFLMWIGFVFSVASLTCQERKLFLRFFFLLYICISVYTEHCRSIESVMSYVRQNAFGMYHRSFISYGINT